MSRGVDRFYRCLAASIDFIDVARCLATSIDVEVNWMGADQGDDDDNVDRFYRCLATSIDFINVSRCLATSIDVDTCRIEVGWAQTRATTTTTTTSIDFIDVSRRR